VEKWLEKLKSHDDDQKEHSSCGGYRHGMSMQRYCAHCMYKVHKSYKYTIQRRDVVVVVVGVVVDAIVEGDSCMKKDQSATAEKNRRRNV
jgi:hypothetical protein